ASSRSSGSGSCTSSVPPRDLRKILSPGRRNRGRGFYIPGESRRYGRTNRRRCHDDLGRDPDPAAGQGKAAARRARDPKAMVEGYADQVVVFNLAPPLQQTENARDTGPIEQWLSTFHG